MSGPKTSLAIRQTYVVWLVGYEILTLASASPAYVKTFSVFEYEGRPECRPLIKSASRILVSDYCLPYRRGRTRDPSVFVWIVIVCGVVRGKIESTAVRDEATRRRLDR